VVPKLIKPCPAGYGSTYIDVKIPTLKFTGLALPYGLELKKICLPDELIESLETAAFNASNGVSR
jgi:hypothetical protein